MSVKKIKCYFGCGKDLNVNYFQKQVSIDGSGWNENMEWPDIGKGYVLVEGLSCTPVVVCSNCKNKIHNAKREPQVTSWSRIKILKEMKDVYGKPWKLKWVETQYCGKRK